VHESRQASQDPWLSNEEMLQDGKQLLSVKQREQPSQFSVLKSFISAGSKTNNWNK
jgi:hypothetical protein